MSQSKWFRRAAGAVLVCASVVSIAPFGGPAVPAVSAQTADQGGEFHALPPTRILDTRPTENINDVRPFGAKMMLPDPVANKSAEFQFNPLGKGGLPGDAADVLAIVANVTVTGSSTRGWVAMYASDFVFGGADGTDQLSSLVNFTAGASVPNLAIIGLDPSGNLTFNSGGAVVGSYHVIVDVLGFISTSQYTGSSTGARLESVDPGRLLDTRNASPIGPGKSISLPIRGANTIIDDAGSPIRTNIVPNRPTVTAALLNLTLVSPATNVAETYLSATPETLDTTKFHTSSSNVIPGRIKANMAVVPIGDDGSIKLYNNVGQLDLVVDVLGYFEQGIHAAGNRGRVVPLEAPFRAFDTRELEFGDAPLQHGSQEEWSFQNFVQSVVLNPDSNPDPGPAQQALIGSLVAIDLQPLYPSHAGGGYASYLRLAPANAKPAEISNVNFFLGDEVANMSLVKYGTSGSDTHVVEAYNDYGKVDYLLDVYAIVLDD